MGLFPGLGTVHRVALLKMLGKILHSSDRLYMAMIASPRCGHASLSAAFGTSSGPGVVFPALFMDSLAGRTLNKENLVKKNLTSS